MSCPSIGQKWFLDCPTCFGQVKIVLVGSKYFCSSPNHFHHVQIRLGPDQTDLDPKPARTLLISGLKSRVLKL